MRHLRPLLVCFLLAPAGCGGSSIYPAGGKVVFPDGTPLPGGVVTCQAVDTELNFSVRGFIQPDGTFRLGTYKANDGAPEGKYRIQIAPPERMIPDERKRLQSSVHARFLRFDTSNLEIIVTPDQSKNDFTLTVERP